MLEYSLVPLFTIAPVYILALISPGPSFALITSLSLARGRKVGVQGAAGLAFGAAIYAILALWGLGILVTQTPWLGMSLKVAGSLYLFYLGLQMWRNFLHTRPETAETKLRPIQSPLWLAFLTTVTNPKALVFYGSIFALAMKHDMNATTKIVTIALLSLLDFTWYTFVALAMSAPTVRARYQHHGKIIDRVIGGILMAFGTSMFFSIWNAAP